MATEAQIQANRANAQKSTGPRTPEGKEKASQNSLKHGLFARETVIRGEDEREFEIYRDDLLDQLIPGSPVEEMLADRIVGLSWRLKRAVDDQTDAFAALYEKYVAQQAAGEPEAGSASSGAGIPSAALSGQALPVSLNQGQDAHATIGRMILEDFSGEGVLDRLLRYERRIEGSLYRTLKEMRGVFDQRKKALEETGKTLERWREEDWEAKKARAFARCSAPVVSAGPAGLTTNITGAQGPHCSNLPSFQDSFAAPMPEGPGDNESCKTNPIPEEVSSLKCQVSGETCKTNPISEDGPTCLGHQGRA